MNHEPDCEIEIIHAESEPPQRSRLTRWLEKTGGGSLAVSVLVHGVFVVIALLVIWRTQTVSPAEDISFLPSGGGGTDGQTAIAQTKARMIVNRAPQLKVVSEAVGPVALPAATKSIAAFTHASTASGMMSGTPGTGGNWGGGKNGGIGPGDGKGIGPGKDIGGIIFPPASGNNIVICIDTSGSMRINLKDTGIAAIRRELKKVISDLPPGIQFNLICFGQSADIFKPKSVSATPEMKTEALRFLEGYYGGANADFGRTRTERFGREGKDTNGIAYVPLQPDDIEELAGTEGGSRIDLAMVAAFERNPSTLYVLSDGAPGTRKSGTAEPMDKDAIIDLIHTKYQEIMGGRSRILVNTISIYSDTEEGREGEAFLKKLAKKFGGKHREVKPEKLK